MARRVLAALASQVGWELAALRQLKARGRVRRLMSVMTVSELTVYFSCVESLPFTAYQSTAVLSLRYIGVSLGQEGAGGVSSLTHQR